MRVFKIHIKGVYKKIVILIIKTSIQHAPTTRSKTYSSGEKHRCVSIHGNALYAKRGCDRFGRAASFLQGWNGPSGSFGSCHKSKYNGRGLRAGRGRFYLGSWYRGGIKGDDELGKGMGTERTGHNLFCTSARRAAAVFMAVALWFNHPNFDLFLLPTEMDAFDFDDDVWGIYAVGFLNDMKTFRCAPFADVSHACTAIYHPSQNFVYR